MKILLLLSLCLWGCTQMQRDYEADDPPNIIVGERLSAAEVDIVVELTENAFWEARSESIQAVEVQIYSVLNRSKRWTKKGIVETIRQPWAYSWRHDKRLTRAKRERYRERNADLYRKIFRTAWELYVKDKNGLPIEGMPITNADHYITLHKARTSPPYWYTHYCKDKIIVDAHVYCTGVPKLDTKFK